MNRKTMLTECSMAKQYLTRIVIESWIFHLHKMDLKLSNKAKIFYSHSTRLTSLAIIYLLYTHCKLMQVISMKFYMNF